MAGDMVCSMSTLLTLNCVVCMCILCVIIGRMQHHNTLLVLPVYIQKGLREFGNTRVRNTVVVVTFNLPLTKKSYTDETCKRGSTSRARVVSENTPDRILLRTSLFQFAAKNQFSPPSVRKDHKISTRTVRDDTLTGTKGTGPE
jgi:hypothetical protein